MLARRSGLLRARLTQTFNDLVTVTVVNRRTNFSTAFVSIYILAKPGTNDPSLLVGNGFRPSLSPDATRFVFTRLSTSRRTRARKSGSPTPTEPTYGGLPAIQMPAFTPRNGGQTVRSLWSARMVFMTPIAWVPSIG